MTSTINSTAMSPPRPVMTVQGPVSYESLGITDAHNHEWISQVPGTGPGCFVLDQFGPMVQELIEYRERGGHALLDCQPGGCGRDGNQLLALSKASGVTLIACTGFHRRKYYATDYWLWRAGAREIADSFCSEIQQGVAETAYSAEPVRAGFIKIALEATWDACPQAALEGAAEAARRARVVMEIHTEKGALAERACIYFADHGVPPTQLVLCHMDKRPDVSLHQGLARLGVLLEYDTFLRPKYNPANNLWPLLESMVKAGLADHVALATDLAEAPLYHYSGGGPGLASLPGQIADELNRKGFPETVRRQLLGGNIARRLAGIN